MTDQLIHIALDLETWGTEPGCDIRSIGAVVFDPFTGLGETFYRAVRTSPWVDLRKDPSTVSWWNDQSEAAQGAFADPVLTSVALDDFTAWLLQVAPDASQVRLWSHGASFDPPILAAVYRAHNRLWPVHYRAPRDSRTIFEVAGFDPVKCLDDYTEKGDIEHHALDDAKVTARAIIAAMKVIHANQWLRMVYDEAPTKQDVANELSDFAFVLEQLPRVYMHATGDRMSKANYYADDIIRQIDDHVEERIEDAQRDLIDMLLGADDPVEAMRQWRIDHHLDS